MFDGVRTPLTDLHVAIMLSFLALILDFTSQALRLPTFFLQDWKFENNWLLPPVSQIVRVVDHLRLSNTEGTLVIPMWKSSYFWVLLRNDGRHWTSFVHDWVVLPKFKQNCER